MIEKILQKLSNFKIAKIDISNNEINLHIQLTVGQNADEQENIIKQLIPECNLNITFLIKEDTKKQFHKIIGVSSGKGGVGKSTISLHIAFALKEMGHTVGILDADIYAPSIPVMLNVSDNPISIDGNLIEPVKTVHGFQLLSMGLFLQSNQATLWRSDLLVSAFNQFLEQSNWQCEYLIIDLPPGTSDIHNSLAKIAPQAKIILITEPTKIAYADMYRMYATVKALNMDVLGLIVNKTYFYCQRCKHKELYTTNTTLGQEIPIITSLPIFPHLHAFIENSYPIDYIMQDEKELFLSICKKILQ